MLVHIYLLGWLEVHSGFIRSYSINLNEPLGQPDACVFTLTYTHILEFCAKTMLYFPPGQKGARPAGSQRRLHQAKASPGTKGEGRGREETAPENAQAAPALLPRAASLVDVSTSDLSRKPGWLHLCVRSTQHRGDEGLKIHRLSQALRADGDQL